MHPSLMPRKNTGGARAYHIGAYAYAFLCMPIHYMSGLFLEGLFATLHSIDQPKDPPRALTLQACAMHYRVSLVLAITVALSIASIYH
jgi:hypothetical protein